MGMAQEADVCYNDSVIKAIAEKCGKTAPQVTLRWAVQRGTAIIPKSIKPERLAQNIDIYNFTLSDEDMKSIDALDKHRRFNNPANYTEPAFGLFSPIFD